MAGAAAGTSLLRRAPDAYVIVFVPETDPVEIVAVIDGTRNLGKISLG